MNNGASKLDCTALPRNGNNCRVSNTSKRVLVSCSPGSQASEFLFSTGNWTKLEGLDPAAWSRVLAFDDRVVIVTVPARVSARALRFSLCRSDPFPLKIVRMSYTGPQGFAQSSPAPCVGRTR